MKRFTKRIGEHVYYTMGKYEETLPAECESQDVRLILKHLADYEDLNLTPEEIRSILHDGGIKIAMRNRELRELAELPWKKAPKNLPDKAGNYICTVKWEDGSVSVKQVWFHNGIRTDILWELDGMEAPVTHWMEFPEPPKEAKA